MNSPFLFVRSSTRCPSSFSSVRINTYAFPTAAPFRRVYSEVLAAPADLPALKESLTALLEYLSGQGRTNANCWAVDMFFCLSKGWESDWTEQHLPGDFHDVLALMGEALHDTVRTPKIAENFDCLPEQLIARV